MLHLIKLCVGVDSLQELADWQDTEVSPPDCGGPHGRGVLSTRQVLPFHCSASSQS